MNTLSFWTISEFVIVHVDVHTYVCVCVCVCTLSSRVPLWKMKAMEKTPRNFSFVSWFWSGGGDVVPAN